MSAVEYHKWLFLRRQLEQKRLEQQRQHLEMERDAAAIEASLSMSRSPAGVHGYYAERGESPLQWGGQGAERLGLAGEVTLAQYELLFGPGGAIDPAFGRRLVSTSRPGIELVVAAHKSVALLGLLGREADMHAILTAETEATMAYLEHFICQHGGRRGRAQVRTATGGLTYAVTRHATSRAGDPALHDHVLIANVVEMLDAKGGWKALDTAALRDLVHAATIYGRTVSAQTARRLGYAIAPDNGPSGRLRHWRIVGVPERLCELFSKRSDEIDEFLGEVGYQGYEARSLAARTTRAPKEHVPLNELMPGWVTELEAAGYTIHGIVRSIDRTGLEQLRYAGPAIDIEQTAHELLASDGELAARKVFTRHDVVVAAGHLCYDQPTGTLHAVQERVLELAIPLVDVARAREQCFAPLEVLATEQAIAQTVDILATEPGVALAPGNVAQTVAEMVAERPGQRLTDGQRTVVDNICTSGRAIDVVIGVAGSGKTTALAAVGEAFSAAGCEVFGTSVSGQAALNLGDETGIPSRTLASLLWRLEHHQLALHPNAVVVMDEAGMTADADLLRLLTAARVAGAKVVLVGDHHQLSAVGPGGALEAVLDRHPHIVTVLDRNLRQRDPAECDALGQLRSGTVETAVDWYLHNDRVHVAETRTAALADTVQDWANDTRRERDTVILAWRRDDVAALNRLARAQWDGQGRLSGPQLNVDGRRYAAGDRVVLLAPVGRHVTSQRATVLRVDLEHWTVTVRIGNEIRELAGRQLSRDRLDHAYALTVHRAQGATVDTTHVYMDGGGRELAYVALSRARSETTVHLQADDLQSAREQLVDQWGRSQRQQWVIDTTAPAPPGHPGPAVLVSRETQRLQLTFERRELRHLLRQPLDTRRDDLLAQRARLEAALRDLRTGRGLAMTPAVHELEAARRQRESLEAQANGTGGWRARRQARHELPGAVHLEQRLTSRSPASSTSRTPGYDATSTPSTETSPTCPTTATRRPAGSPHNDDSATSNGNLVSTPARAHG